MNTKAIVLSIVIFGFSIISHSQIAKENWLIGGNASFSNAKYLSEAAAQYKQTDLQFSPMAGYFLMDKFAVGLRPSIVFANNSVNQKSTELSIGPFIRYYLLPSDKIFNLLMEGGYSYGNKSNEGLLSGQTLHTFSVSGGPVLYFNSSVGLEFLMSYSNINGNLFSEHLTKISFGMGFQFYLEKN